MLITLIFRPNSKIFFSFLRSLCTINRRAQCTVLLSFSQYKKLFINFSWYKSRYSSNRANNGWSLHHQRWLLSNCSREAQWKELLRISSVCLAPCGYITSKTKEPEPRDIGAPQRWQSENSMVTPWLINSMKPTLRKTYMFLRAAKEVWEAVQEALFWRGKFILGIWHWNPTMANETRWKRGTNYGH